MFKEMEIVKFKIRKKLSLFMTACVLATGLMSGCSSQQVISETQNGTQSGNAKGRFVENEVSLPDNISMISSTGKSKDGELTLFGYPQDGTAMILGHSKDQGETWDSVEVKDTDCYVSAVNGEDGSVAVFGNPNEKKVILSMVTAEGAVSQVQLQIPDYEGDSPDDEIGNFVTSAVYANGTLLATDLNGVLYEVDSASGKMSRFSQQITDQVEGLLPIGNRFGMLTDSGILFAEADSGKISESMKNDTELQKDLKDVNASYSEDSSSIAFAADDTEQEFYYLNHDGMFYHKIGGSTTEQLMDNSLTSLSDSSVAIQGFHRFDDKNYIVIASDSNGQPHCYRYTYDATISTVPENQIRVYALEDSNALQQLITAYQKEYPDVFVKKIIGMSGSDGVTADDAIKSLNTEVLAGKGPDVLVLDGLPADSYVEKGALCDISNYVEQANESEGLFTNIMDAYTSDNKIYQVPTRFYFTVAEGDSSMLDHSGSIQDFKAYIDTVKSGDEKVFGFFGPKTILNEFYNADSASWRTTSGIDQEKLKDCLEAAKALYDADGYQEKERIEVDFASGMQEGSLIGMCAETVNFRLMMMGQIAFGSLVGVNDAQNLYGMEGAYGGSFALFDTQEHKAFVPFISLGLAQSASDNTYAQKFIEMAISAKGQKQMNDGFSVNRSAFDAECENTHESSIGSSTADGTYSEYLLKKISNAQQQELTTLMESLDVPVWDDRVVKDLVLDEGAKYLQGNQSIEDTVAAISQKVQLYVAE